MHRSMILVGVSVIALAAVAIVIVRLHQRAAFRDEMRPLIQEDLSDFAQEMDTSGEFMIGPAIARREKRIAEVKLFEVGRYRNARDRIARLMEAEDPHLQESEEASENGVRLQDDAKELQLALNQVVIVGSHGQPPSG